jgi:hypothetical protein
MLWGQQIIVYTDHKNLTQDGLGLTSDRVTRWRILLKEYAPEIIYIKGIHNTVADAISRLDYDPKLNTTNEYNHATHVMFTKVEGSQKWMMVTKFWSCFSETRDPEETNTIKINHVFANRSEEEEIFPLTVNEIMAAQKADPILKHFFNRNAVLNKGVELQLVENKSCICGKGRLVIPKPLQRRATIWYHHYLQHLEHTRLEETMKAAIYWKGMRTTIRSTTKSCKTCQINKKRSLKYGHLPSKIVISNPWEALCVDLIGPYTLKGKDGSSIDFMALTMIDRASSWLKVVELPTITRLMTRKVNGKERTIEEEIFDKSSD